MKTRLLQTLAIVACLANNAFADGRPLIKIGLIAPLSGGLAEAGAAFRDAAKLALEDLHADRSFDYELVVEDDQLKSAQVNITAKKLIEIDKVDALISTWSYGGTVAAPIAEKARVPHFGVAWDPKVAAGSYNFIHLTPPSVFLRHFLEEFDKRGLKTVSLVGLNESGSIFAFDEFERLIQGKGIKLLSKDSVNFGDQDFRSIILRLKTKRPEVLLLNLSTPEIDIFMKQLAEAHYAGEVTAITGFDIAENLSQLEGRWYVSDSIVGDSFAARFNQKYGHTRLYGVGNYYDIVSLLINRYERLGKAEPGKKPTSTEIIRSLSSLNGFSSIFGSAEIDDAGIISYPAKLRKIKNGQRVTLEETNSPSPTQTPPIP